MKHDVAPTDGHPDGTVLGSSEDVQFVLREVTVLDQLEPLWLELFDHHVNVGGAGVTTIKRDLSWPRRRKLYENLFAHPGTFVVLAQRDGRAVGYALCHIRTGADDTWDTGDLIGEVETLVLARELREQGHGVALLDIAEAELAYRGAHDVLIGVLAGNDRARRFYERRGMRATVMFLMRLGPRD